MFECRLNMPMRLAMCLSLLLPLLGSCSRSAHPRADSGHAGTQAHEEEIANRQHTGEAVESMASEHRHMGPHMKWTAVRSQNSDDSKRADDIVHELRQALLKYKDHRVALKDGYEPFLPHIAQPRYHFTRKWYGFKAAFGFNPAEPTSLLYKKTANAYDLIGAMFTAPKRMMEEQLNERVPLSVAQWHAHVNICLPPKKKSGTADWTRFGLKGSIATEEKCNAAGGRWFPQIYGWMLHVYPFEDTPEKIWTH